MFAHCLTLIRKSAPVVGIAALILAGRSSGISGEPIQFSNQKEKPEATQEKKNLLRYRAYRPSKVISGAPGINEHLPVPAAPTTVAPPSTSRRNAELIDRQKNWIFLSPGDENKTESAEDALGVDSITLDDEKSKGVLIRFLENKQPNSKSSDGKTTGLDKDQKEFGAPQKFGLGNEKQNRNGNSIQSDSSEKNLIEKNFGMSRDREMSVSDLWKERTSPRGEKMREEQRVRMNEFEGLFGSQNTPPSGGGFGLTGQNGFGLQPANSSVGSDLFNNSAPTPYKLPTAPRNAPRVAAGIGSSALPDINARVFGASAAPAPISQPTRSVPQPSVLPLPKRR